jgi:4-hydroxy-tetrahydrodipicolinate synthase
MAEHAAKIGADAILIGSPPYAVPTERENALNALAIDRAADLPVMLYNYPGRMGTRWARSSSTGWGGRATSARSRKARATSTACTCWRATTRISRCPAAWTTRRWNSSPGARAAGSAAGRTSCPPSISRSTEACAVEGDFDKGRRIMSAMLPLMRVLEQGGKFIQCIKHGCEMADRAGPPRPPLKALNKDDKRQLEQVVRVLKRTIAEIEAEG